jgi:glycosyltransferase involved in cell wall biosynthesis
MKEVLSNFRLAAGAVSEHLTDDPALLALQISRRLPQRFVQPAARLLRGWRGASQLSVTSLIAALISGEQQQVVQRLQLVADQGGLGAEQARALADVALVANQPDLAGLLLSFADGDSRIRGAMARKLWYQGASTEAVEVLRDAESTAERRQGERLAGELRVLEGWQPRLPTVQMQPVEKRVLHVLTNSLPHTASGYAQRTHSILLEQRAAGWEPLAVTRIGYPVQVGKVLAGHQDVVDGIQYRRLLPSKLGRTMDSRLQQQAELLLGIALTFRPSILHTTTHFVNALVTRAVAEAVGIPWVYEVRGQLADTWAASRGPEATESERYGLFHEREAEFMRSADLVVTLGQTMKSNIVDAGVDPSGVLVAPNAVGGDFLDEPMPAREARAHLGIDPDGLYLGTVSSLVAYEGIDDLVAAFIGMAEEHPNVKLLIVGDGTALPSLREQVRKAELADRVIFTGRVPRDQASLYHQALDVFVVPRKDFAVTRDVTPLKPVEAMACARPVVASRLPALNEIVCDGVTGLLVEPENPAALAATLSHLVMSEELRRTLGGAGRKAVLETRTWAANASAIADAYAKLVEKVR